MNLDDHWRKVRAEKAKGRRLPSTPATARAFRASIIERLPQSGWREKSNVDLATALNTLGLKTFEARSWDATSVRTFRAALDKEVERVEAVALSEEEVELKRVRDIQEFARQAIVRSGEPDRSPADIEKDAIDLGLLFVEDRNQSIPGLSGAFDLVAKRSGRAVNRERP